MAISSCAETDVSRWGTVAFRGQAGGTPEAHFAGSEAGGRSCLSPPPGRASSPRVLARATSALPAHEPGRPAGRAVKRDRDANGKFIYNFLILGIEAGFKRYDGAMGLTLSHTSALHAMRLVRSEGVDVREMGHVALAKPTPWRGKRWTTRAFAADTWAWQVPSEKNPLHVLVGSSSRRIRLRTVNCHVSGWKLPAHAVLLLDERTSTVSPGSPMTLFTCTEESVLSELE